MKYLIFDFESSGLNINLAEPLTAYFILCNDSFEIENELDLKFRTQVGDEKYWSKEAQLIHGISYSKARTFKEPIDSIKELLAFLPNGDLCAVCFANYFTEFGHCYFDFALLKNLMDAHHEFNSWTGLFTHRLSLHTEFKKYKKDNAVKGGGGLKDACNYFGIKLNNHHDAKADTFATYELMKEMNSKMKFTIEPWINLRKNIDYEVVV